MKKAAILLSLGLFFTISCAEKEIEPQDTEGKLDSQVSSVNFTPCQQNNLKSTDTSSKVDVKFTDKGVQITHYDFEVTCDFSNVDVTHTFVNGFLNITQQASPNQANCICYTDVSYTINGISQNEVNVIFINGKQVYCYNDNSQITDPNQAFTFTQAYYPTDETSVSIRSGANNLSPYVQSNIWTVDGVPTISRWYMNFDLSDFFKTKNTKIENAILYLYPSTADVCFNQGSASNKSTNKYNVYLVTSDWQSSSLTWNEQPKIDEMASILTDNIPGTMDEPDYTTNYILNLNNVILNNGLLRSNFRGIMSKSSEEDLYAYYRRWLVSSTRSTNAALHPKLKVEYTFPSPKIKSANNIFSVIDNEDLKTLFKNVQYIWTINDTRYTGESVNAAVAVNYNIRLQIVITNNIGEVRSFEVSKKNE